MKMDGTIAVLAGGLANIYPKENKWLYSSILENYGCIITEHQDNEATNMDDFPKRNRIISGIADAVLIIEAKHRSGTRITATYAKSQGKKIYCIPNNLDSVNGVGSNELILEGATFVTSPKQIIKEIKEENNCNKCKQQAIIPDDYRIVYNFLKDKELTNDEIARALNTNISEVNAILTMMELEGYIKQKAGNIFFVL